MSERFRAEWLRRALSAEERGARRSTIGPPSGPRAVFSESPTVVAARAQAAQTYNNPAKNTITPIRLAAST
jgi:hypothetical protein